MRAKLQMILAMVLYGTISVFVRGIPLTSAEIALLRAGIALAALLAWRFARRAPAPARGLGRDVPLLLLSGAAMGFNWIFLFEAYKYTTVSVATLSYYFAPVIVIVASPILFRERMTRRQALCFVGATAGLVLVIDVGALSSNAGQLRGVAFGLAAAVLYASVILMNKGIRGVSGLDRTILQFAAAAGVLLPYVLITTGIHMEYMDAAGWARLICVGVVHSGVAYVLYFSALRTLSGQQTAILSYIDPLVAVLISVAVLRERATAAQLLGGAMILAFTLLSERAAARPCKET